jgi:hypothetical protein
MTKLRIADDLKLPIDAVTQRISILGKTRSGKSYTASILVEEVLKAQQQVVILDPKGDWWGLRSSANGKSAGLPILIMGGKHGDVPLEPTAGALVADLVVNERISVILDFSLFESKADEIRFVTAFLDRLYRKNTEPILLVIDEADVFCPQRPERNETVMLNRMETICRRGAGRGIGVVLISQRSASIHKGCLSQTELMIAHQTTAPQDKEAIKAWVVDHGDEERREDFMTTVPKLPKGVAIVWSPSWLEIYKQVSIRRKETYDSSAAPKVGQSRRPPKILAQVDLERLRKHMADTIEKAKQEDPRALQDEIRKLKAQLAAKPNPKPKWGPPPSAAPAPSKYDEKIVEVPIMGKREVKRLEKLVTRIEEAKKSYWMTTTSLENATRDIAAVLQRLKDGASTNEIRKSIGLAPVKEKPSPLKVQPISYEERMVKTERSKIDKCAKAILGVLVQYAEGCSIGKISLLAGYRQSGSFMSTISGLRTQGYLTGSNSSMMQITEEGRAALGPHAPLPEGVQLAQYWLQHQSFGLCERKILEAVLGAPDGLTLEQICERTGYSQSGSFMSSLSSLRTAGVLVGKNSEKMSAAEALYG